MVSDEPLVSVDYIGTLQSSTVDALSTSVVGGTLQAGDDAAEVRWVARPEFDALPLAAGLAGALAEWGLLPG